MITRLQAERVRSRTCGIILHPTSLPGRYGIGDLGPRRVASWTSSRGPGRASGRCCRWARPATATLPTSASRPSRATRCSSASRRSSRRVALGASDARRRRPPSRSARWTSGPSPASSLPLLDRGLRALRRAEPARGSAARFEAFCRTRSEPGSTTTRSSWRSRTRTAGGPGPSGSGTWRGGEPPALARARTQLRRRDPSRQVRAVPVLRAVGGAAQHAPRARHPDHGRPADLRRPRQRRRLGASRAVPPRGRRRSRPTSRASRPTTSAPPDSAGATRSTAGTALRKTGYALVDRALPGGAGASSTSSASTTSAASRRTGRSRPREPTAVQRALGEGPGGGVLRARSSARSARCRSWPRTWA